MSRPVFTFVCVILVTIYANAQLKCGYNEDKTECPVDCPTDYCPTSDRPEKPCPKPQVCGEPECKCQFNTRRAANGTCIDTIHCRDEDCGPNEILHQCPMDCASDYCPTSDKKSPACVKSDSDQCCKCRFNYRRAENGTCIPTRDCPPFDCSSRPNEEYNSCPPLCPTDDCSQASPSGECPLIGRIGIVLPCNPKCRCIKGYWRKDEVCVPYEQCNQN